jgi:hypothetical protein
MELGASYRLFQTLETGQWRPNISPALALEYEAVLKRMSGNAALSTEAVDDLIEYRILELAFRYPGIDCDLQPQGLRRLRAARREDHDTERTAGCDRRLNMDVTITVSDQVYQQATEVAKAEGVSVEQLFAAAFEQKLVELERLKERAARGSYKSSAR